MTEGTNAWREDESHTQPHPDTMGQYELVILGGDRRHHHAKYVKRSADDDECFEVSRIEERAGDTSQQWTETELD